MPSEPALRKRIAHLRQREIETRNPQTSQQKRVRTLNCNALREALRRLACLQATGSYATWTDYRLDQDPCDNPES